MEKILCFLLVVPVARLGIHGKLRLTPKNCRARVAMFPSWSYYLHLRHFRCLLGM